MKTVYALLLLLLTASVAFAGNTAKQAPSPQQRHAKAAVKPTARKSTAAKHPAQKSAERENLPLALARHLRRLQASPAHGNEADGSVATAGDEAFAHRAY